MPALSVPALTNLTLLTAASTTTTLLILFTTTAIRLHRLNTTLAQRITSHHTSSGAAARTLLSPQPTKSRSGPNATSTNTDSTLTLPFGAPHAHLSPLLRISPGDYNIFHDVSTLTIRAHTLPSHLTSSEMLTLYLRHTMGLFAGTPQGWVLWAFSPREWRGSFGRAWIQGLGFVGGKGERVGGVYEVLAREVVLDGEGEVVVFGMRQGAVEGRLMVGLKREGEEEGVVFATETWMWVAKEARVVMPMERGVPRWMHRVVSQWLLVRGTGYLQGLKKG